MQEMNIQSKAFICVGLLGLCFLASCASPDVPKISDVPVLDEQLIPQTEMWHVDELKADKQKALEQREKILSNDEEKESR